MVVSRFDTPSVSLVLNGLLKRTRKAMVTALVIALAAHLTTTQLRLSVAEHKAVKPLTTHFIKREPRLTKPLELKKRPQPRKRPIHRTMVSVKARMTRGESRSRFESALGIAGLVRPRVAIGRISGDKEQDMEPEAIAGAVKPAREVEQKIDMSLELLDIESLDIGKHHALVIQDPNDKRGIRGFCRLAVLFSRAMYPVTGGYSFDRYLLPGFLRVPEAMNQFTDIKTDVLGRLAPGDERLFKAPWVFFGAHDYVPMPSAIGLANLGRYMASGGFIFADCHNYWLRGTTACYQSLHSILLEALAAQGLDTSFEKVPNNHPVYHCYFDFEGPPVGGESVDKGHYPDLVRINRSLEGLEVDGRLVALLSGKLISGGWRFGDHPWTKDWDAKRPLQFAVNMIVFALTQEGSITHRLMESIR